MLTPLDALVSKTVSSSTPEEKDYFSLGNQISININNNKKNSSPIKLSKDWAYPGQITN